MHIFELQIVTETHTFVYFFPLELSYAKFAKIATLFCVSYVLILYDRVIFL